MLEHILIPLDGSLLAESAVDEARVVVPVSSKIRLLSIVQKPSIPLYGYEMAVTFKASYEIALQEAFTLAKSYVERIAQDLRVDGYTVSTIVEFGTDPADVIVRKAAQYGVDAVVMTTHGRSGVSRWLFGSVTGKVLANATCPVLVIPSKHHLHAAVNTEQQNYAN